MALTVIISIICGFGVGILSGLLGVGGGMIVIPLLRLGFGLDGLIAAGTSLFSIFFTSVSGTVGRMRTKTVNLKVGALVGIGGILLSPVGSWASEIAGGTAAMIAAAIVIAYTAIVMIRKGVKLPGRNAIARSDAGEGPHVEKPVFADVHSLDMTPRNVVLMLVVGAIAGFASGFIGVGGGFIIVPLLVAFFNISMKDASGTSLVALCLLAIPGFITHGFFGHVDWIKGVAIAAGSIPGAQLGASLVKRVPEKALRIAFGILLAAMAVSLVLKEFI